MINPGGRTSETGFGHQHLHKALTHVSRHMCLCRWMLRKLLLLWSTILLETCIWGVAPLEQALGIRRTMWTMVMLDGHHHAELGGRRLVRCASLSLYDMLMLQLLFESRAMALGIRHTT